MHLSASRVAAAMTCGSIVVLVCACLPVPTRNPKAKETGQWDLRAVAYYVGTPEQDVKTEYLTGDCTKAPDADQRNFCEGKLDAVRDPNIVAFARGRSDSACAKITNNDFKLYCQASWAKYPVVTPCFDIQNPRLAKLCSDWNETLMVSKGGGGRGRGGQPQPPAEEDNCIPTGQELPTQHDICCSRKNINTGHSTLCCEDGPGCG